MLNPHTRTVLPISVLGDRTYIFTGVAVISLLLICAIVMLGGSYINVVRGPIQEQRVAVEVGRARISEYLSAMEVRDVNRAMLAFSVNRRSQASAAHLSEMLSGDEYVLFDDFEDLDPTPRVSFVKAGQQTLIYLSGDIYYDLAFTGVFTAELLAPAGSIRDAMIETVEVVVSEDKRRWYQDHK